MVNRSRFLDALRKGRTIDAAFGEAAAVEATQAGQGRPLDLRLLHDCVTDAAKAGGSAKEIFERAACDKRLSFRDELMMAEPDGGMVEGQGDAATSDEHEGFEKLEHSLAHEKGVDHPAALVAWIGRKKLGAKAFNRRAAAGR